MTGYVRERLVTAARFVEILGAVLAEAVRYKLSSDPLPEHVHRLVVRLGPTFVKLGQIASARPDLVPPDVSERLEDLQENVPPFPYSEARAVVERELGAPPETAFRQFPTQPVASASLSQVYFATLDDGTEVAVKVQRPGIRDQMERDLRVVRALARIVAVTGLVPRRLPVVRIVDEFARWTLKELDFEVEGHNLEEFRRNFADWDDVTFPAVSWDHTTRRVLTMERVSGMRLGEVPDAVSEQRQRDLARRLSELLIEMFVADGFFHADLHPGNVFFGRDGSIAVLDVGMVGRMTTEQRDRFLAYWIAITRRQRDRAFHHLLAMAESTERADLDGYRDRYDVLLDRFYDADLSERSLAQTYLEIVYAGAEHGVVFPSELVLQAKAVVTAESLTLVLAPEFRFADEIRPIVAEELAKRAAPQAAMDRAWGSWSTGSYLGRVELAARRRRPSNRTRRRSDGRRSERSRMSGPTTSTHCFATCRPTFQSTPPPSTGEIIPSITRCWKPLSASSGCSRPNWNASRGGAASKEETNQPPSCPWAGRQTCRTNSRPKSSPA
ncbi:ABC1 kinase family protein [Halosimplex aquaticum]